MSIKKVRLPAHFYQSTGGSFWQIGILGEKAGSTNCANEPPSCGTPPY